VVDFFTAGLPGATILGQPAIYVHPLEDKKHPILDGKKWVPLLEDKKQPILDGDK